MAADFDLFPFYDPLLKSGANRMSDTWVGALSTFIQTLTGYLSQYGIFTPNLTTTERDTIKSPINGQFIYNTTIDKPQFFQASSNSWRTLTFT